MKTRYLLLAGLIAACVLMTGCGCGKKNNDSEKKTEETVSPTEGTTSKQDDLVEMQAPTNISDIKNVIGEKRAGASELIIENRTGSDIAYIYIRGTIDDDEEWGSELIQDAFVLKTGEKAAYYYDPTEKDLYGNTPTTYDIRVGYEDTSKNECFFRYLSMKDMSKIVLKMDGSGEDSIPYATYTKGTDKKEYSTLEEVKKRLGLIASEEDSEDTSEEDSYDTGYDADYSEDTSQDDTYQPSTPEEEPTTPEQPEEEPEFPEEEDPGASSAKNFIGHSLEELINAMGSPSADDYQVEPETGKTGYHYYDTFTVSTIVDDEGNETVAGVW